MNHLEPTTVNFGNLAPLPEGYEVRWHPNLEMYMAHGPDDWESGICWNRYWCRAWCFERASERGDLDCETLLGIIVICYLVVQFANWLWPAA